MDEMRNSSTIIHSRKDNIMLAKNLNVKQDGYTKSENYLEQMARISSKYIRLQPRIREWIEKEQEKNIDRKSVV